jgi:hypothetical protein
LATTPHSSETACCGLLRAVHTATRRLRPLFVTVARESTASVLTDIPAASSKASMGAWVPQTIEDNTEMPRLLLPDISSRDNLMLKRGCRIAYSADPRACFNSRVLGWEAYKTLFAAGAKSQATNVFVALFAGMRQKASGIREPWSLSVIVMCSSANRRPSSTFSERMQP